MEWRAPAFRKLADRVKGILEGEGESRKKLSEVCDLLAAEVSHYDWVGFYLLDPEDDRGLILGPYHGASTEHVKIPFGAGICGQAAESGETFIVRDISKEWNYLACNPAVKAEIVVPVFKKGRFVGEIDIDSHTLNPFTAQDMIFLEELSRWVAPLLPG